MISHTSPFLVHVTYDRGLVVLWRRSDMLFTSGFIFDHKLKLFDVAAHLKRTQLWDWLSTVRVIQAAGQRTH